MRHIKNFYILNMPARTLLVKRPQGMTLVELLVAITLGLLVIAGIGQIYTAAKRSYDIQTNMSRLQDAGRYAIDILTRDIQRAGFWGLTDMRYLIANNVVIPGNDVAPNGTCPSSNTAWGTMIRERIFGLNDNVPPLFYPCISDDWLPGGGDVLVVRYADPAQPNSCSDTAQYSYIRTWPYSYLVSQSTNPECTSNQPGTTVHRVVARAYYVQRNSDATCNGTIPSLAMEELTTGGLPIKRDLIVGVENLQFQFGVDTDNNNSVNQYVNANQISNWNQVVAVRLWVLVRSECPETGYNNNAQYTMGDTPPFTKNDSYRRQLYSTTVALRN